MLKNFLIILAYNLLATTNLFAAPSESDSVIPDELKKWVPWVESQNPNWRCPRASSLNAGELAYQCNWIGNIELALTNINAKFKISGILYVKDAVALPNPLDTLPSDISVKRNGIEFNEFSISKRESGLYLNLPPGEYEIFGKLQWGKIPTHIPLPENYGIVSFTLDESLKEYQVTRNANDLILTLENNSTNLNSIEIQVFRRLTDGNPMFLDTKINLKISGRPRSIEIGKILPKEAKIVKVNSPLSVSIDEKGLNAQVYQGDYSIEVQSILPNPINSIEIPKPQNTNWPAEELWAWEPNPLFRLIEIKNALNINENQVNLPPDWKATNLMSIKVGSNLELVEKRRGEEVALKNNLKLERTIWPKIDRSGYTIADNFTGILNDNFRLNALSNLQLGSAKDNNVEIPISIDPDTKLRGVELRNQHLQLNTISEAEYKSDISSVGWETEVQSLGINLAIPPSWKLLHVSNASSVYGSWTSKWTIFDIFLLFIFTYFAANLLSRNIALTLLAFLVLSKSEFLVPYIFFGYILFFVACLKALGDSSTNKFRIALQQASLIGAIASVVAFSVQALSFSKLQFMQLLFPQLQSGTRYRTLIQELVGTLNTSPHYWPIFLITLFIVYVLFRWSLKGKNVGHTILRFVLSGFICIGVLPTLFAVSHFINPIYFGDSSYAPHSNFQNEENSNIIQSSGLTRTPLMFKKFEANEDLGASELAQKEKSYSERTLQSGPSLPAWKWRMARINFSGPIDASHNLKIYLIPSQIEQIFCALRFILSIVLLGLTLSKFIHILKSENYIQLNAFPKLFVFILILCPFSAKADYPDQNLLNSLREHLNQNQCLQESCAKIDSCVLNLHESSFNLKLIAYSQGNSVITAVGPIEELTPSEIKVNDKITKAIRAESNFLQIKTSPGINLIEIRGQLPKKDILNLRFSEKPLNLEIISQHWDTTFRPQGSDIPDNIRVTKSIENLEDSKLDNKNSDLVKSQTETWFIVNRHLDISDSVSITGSIMRIGDLEKTTSVNIPLQNQEQILSSALTSDSSNVFIQFPAGVSTVDFTSKLPLIDSIVLTASNQNMISEVWSFTCADYLNCDHSGLVPTSSLQNNRLEPTFMPLPSESMTILPKVLASASGNFLTIESINHEISWGEKVLSGTILLNAKATKQTNLDFSFKDPSIQIDSLTINGQADTRKFEHLASALLNPGTQNISLQYSQKFKPKFNEKSPKITINNGAGNITTVIKPSHDRWTLWVGGSYWGPAVIFWSKLFVVIIGVLLLRQYQIVHITLYSAIAISFAISFLPTLIQPIPLIWIYLSQCDKLKSLISPKIFKIGLALACIISVFLFYTIIKVGLLFDPPFLITGNGSSLYNLRWFDDFIMGDTNTSLPQPYVISLPIIVWRGLTLGISLFLVIAGITLIKKTIQLLKEDVSPQ